MKSIDANIAYDFATKLQSKRGRVMTAFKRSWLNKDSKAAMLILMGESFAKEYKHSFFRSLSLEEWVDRARVSEGEWSLMTQKLLKLNARLKISSRYDSNPNGGLTEKKFTLLPPRRKGYKLFWWIEMIYESNEPVYYMNWCLVEFRVLNRLLKDQYIFRRDRGQLANLPLFLLNSDCYYLGDLAGPWGRAPIAITRAHPDCAAFHEIVPKKILDLACNGSVANFIRVHANPSGSLDAVKRCSKKSEGTITLNEIRESFDEYEKHHQMKMPHLVGDWSPEMFVALAKINGKKQAGAVGRLGFNEDKSKRNFYQQIATTALAVCEHLRYKSEDLYDTSIYQSGGRHKKFVATEGKRLSSRPVWMASAINEVMLDFYVHLNILASKTQGVDHPIWIGRSAKQSRYKDVINTIGAPDRIGAHADFSKYDSTISPVLMDWVFGLIRSTLPPGKIWDRFVTFCWSSATHHPLIQPGGELYLFKRGMPSGIKLTAFANSLIADTIKRVWFTKHKTWPQYKELLENKEATPVLTQHLGDDVTAVSTNKTTDGIIRSCAISWSKMSKELFDMDLDPAITSRFAPKDPEVRGIIFLQDTYYQDVSLGSGVESIKPTVQSHVAMKRLGVPEKAAIRKLFQRRMSILRDISCTHPEGAYVHAKLMKWAYNMEYRNFEDWPESLQDIVTARVTDDHYESIRRVFGKEEKAWYERSDSKDELFLTSSVNPKYLTTACFRSKLNRFLLGTFGAESKKLMKTSAYLNPGKAIKNLKYAIFDIYTLGKNLEFFGNVLD